MRKITIFLILILYLGSCKKDTSDDFRLTLQSSYTMSVVEASGLSNYSNGHFLTISDTLEHVFVINEQGMVLDTLPYQGNNPEGVAWDANSNKIYIVEEKTNEVVILDEAGEEVNRFAVQVNNLYEKHGLEGITINNNNNHLFLVSEKSPSLLFEFSTDGAEINRWTLTFAKDYSSVFYDTYLNKLWILSDNSETLTRCDLTGKAEETWQTGITKAEGVVVDSQARLVYIVSDQTHKFYILSF
ncbi:MAG TPA: SdiA-regulated domain-containing protein [Bacteroidales bacterium]|nr:SdiA-regulated domain-containing protein [Bacteroidales bacterium]HRX95498.1 SdiA-regulated domain-containing protein [Bacteroidales bacterium]